MNTFTAQSRNLVAGTFLLLALAPFTACGTENAQAPAQSIGDSVRQGSADSIERQGERNAQGTTAPEDFGGPGYRFCRFKTDTECWNGTGTRYRSGGTDNYPHGLVR